MNSLLPAEIRYREIYRYATFAKAAYLDHPELELEFGDSVFVRELAASRVQIALINDSGANVQWITIRGTSNPKNALVDGRVKVVREKPRMSASQRSGQRLTLPFTVIEQ